MIKTDTQITIPLHKLTEADIKWIERRTSLPLCSVRVAADLHAFTQINRNIAFIYLDPVVKPRDDTREKYTDKFEI